MDKPEGGIKRKSRLAVFEHVTEKQKSPKRAKFRPSRLNLEDSSPSECELVIDDKQEPVKKKKSVLIKFTEEPLNLQCEWSFCDEIFDSWSKFNTHLLDHATVDSEDFMCHWTDCKARSSDVTLLSQHVSFHGYLTKLKNIGHNVVFRNNLPPCRLKEFYTVPIYPRGYTCDWEHCSFKFYTIYEFCTHMEVHIKNNPKKCTENSEIACGWRDCNTTYSTQYKLAEHLRTHTKEKTIACPTCCTLFSNKTKFCDHRKRQLSTNLQSYQCSQCLKLFASERLLRDHMRSHINHYKCTMCDMTCPKPSSLAKHIRFKHIGEKHYKCQDCSKTFVAKHNLDVHVRTHKSNEMHCEQCEFTCRSKVGLDNHLIKVHANHTQIYECHCCKKKYKRGGYLTKHLMKRHNYHWPSGHSRFRYRKDQDGICRLQTVRYESLEVTQEMIRSESMQTNNSSKGKSYNLKYDNDGQSKYVLSVSENGESSVKSTEPNERTILITINDVDEQGNIVNSKVVESRELVGTTLKADVISEHPLPKPAESQEEERISNLEYEGKSITNCNSDIITKHPLPDPTDSPEEDRIVEPECVAKSATICKSDIVLKEHPLPDQTKSREGTRAIKYKRKSTSKSNVELSRTEEGKEKCIKVGEPKTEDIRYFSKEVILNYDKFKIETTKT